MVFARSCGPDKIKRWARFDPRALSLTHMVLGIQCSLHRFQLSCVAKQPQIIIKPLPCFIAGMLFFLDTFHFSICEHRDDVICPRGKKAPVLSHQWKGHSLWNFPAHQHGLWQIEVCFFLHVSYIDLEVQLERLWMFSWLLLCHLHHSSNEPWSCISFCSLIQDGWLQSHGPHTS